MTTQNKMTLQGETQTRSLQSLENCLMRTGLLFSRSLTVEEAQVWKDFLVTYSPEAIEYAFENWQRNGKFFPKPADILELIRAYRITKRVKPRTTYEHHGEGYNESDILYLFKRMVALKASLPNRQLTDGEINSLLDDLDKKRGETPAWRKTA